MATFSDAITTAAQLHQAETATYLADAVIGVVFIVIILIIANNIAWQPGAHDPSPAKRRKWFYVLGIASLFVSLFANYYFWMRHITKAQFVSEYITHMVIAAVMCTAIYGIVTFLISGKIQKKETKLASIF